MLVVGEGKSKDDFIEQSEELGLKDDIKFLGKILDRDMLKSIFARADLFIFPSVYDATHSKQRKAQ